MKKILKILGFALVGMVAAIVLVLTYIAIPPIVNRVIRTEFE